MKHPRFSPAELITQKSDSTVRVCVSSIAVAAAPLDASPHGRSFAPNVRPEKAVGWGGGDGEGEAVPEGEADTVVDGEGSGSSVAPAPSVTQYVRSVTSTSRAVRAASASFFVGKHSSCSPAALTRQDPSSLAVGEGDAPGVEVGVTSARGATVIAAFAASASSSVA
jgi:hypothetical protein